MELHTILTAVDPTAAELPALRASAQLAAAARARLLVLSVTDNPWKLLGPEEETYADRTPSRGELIALAAERLGQRLGPLLDSPLGPDEVAYHVGIGVPAVEVARWSETEGADLIVLGREPRGRLQRAEISGTIEGTIRRAGVPCLIVTSGPNTYRRILAAVDAGPDSTAVLEASFALGRLFGSQVLAQHVERPLALAEAALPRTETMRHATAVAGAAAAAWSHDPAESRADPAASREPLAACDVIVRQGDPVAEILKAIREEGIELLVHGHHRGGPSNGHETGSIASRLLQRAPCAVLTVPV